MGKNFMGRKAWRTRPPEAQEEEHSAWRGSDGGGSEPSLQELVVEPVAADVTRIVVSRITQFIVVVVGTPENTEDGPQLADLICQVKQEQAEWAEDQTAAAEQKEVETFDGASAEEAKGDVEVAEPCSEQTGENKFEKDEDEEKRSWATTLASAAVCEVASPGEVKRSVKEQVSAYQWKRNVGGLENKPSDKTSKKKQAKPREKEKEVRAEVRQAFFDDPFGKDMEPAKGNVTFLSLAILVAVSAAALGQSAMQVAKEEDAPNISYSVPDVIDLFAADQEATSELSDEQEPWEPGEDEEESADTFEGEDLEVDGEEGYGSRDAESSFEYEQKKAGSAQGGAVEGSHFSDNRI